MTGSRASEAVLDRITSLLHRRIGLRREQTLRSRLDRCLRDGAVEFGQNLDAYVECVLADPDMLQRLVNRMTVQETAFFRHREHFEVLAREILPVLDGPVAMWSAACANGQEAFSLAIVLEEQGIDGAVFATDLSTAAVQRTRTARYTKRELAGLSPEQVDRHFTRVGDDWEVRARIRDRVTVTQHNLLDDLPPHVARCQVVFCRNVLIYFSLEHARAFLGRLADLSPAAALFVGSAETIWSVTDRFDTVHTGGTFFYRPRSASPAIVAPAVPVSRPAHRRVVPSEAVRSASVPPRPRTADPDSTTLERLTLTGQRRAAEGDHAAAAVAFRKCAFLAPHDPIAHLHLALVLDAAGDRTSARRAYSAARQALLDSGPASAGRATEGYTSADLLRLLDTRLQMIEP
jgi:chemotaxis methyl-accepting protein methylase